MARSTVPTRTHSRRRIQRIRRQSSSSRYRKNSDNNVNDDDDDDDGNSDSSSSSSPNALQWAFKSDEYVPACSDYTFSWSGSAKQPYMLTAHQRDNNATTEELNTAAGWYNFIIAKDISDNYYTWTVNSPINTTVSYTLSDANGQKLDSQAPIEVVTNGLGRYADQWCMVSNNAAQQDGTPTSLAASSSVAAASGSASALVTVYPGQDNTTAQQDTSPWALVDTYQSRLKKAHAAIGALAALFTLAIILGLIGFRIHTSLRKEYQRLVQTAPEPNNADTAVDMSRMEKQEVDDAQNRGTASQSRRSLLDRDDLAYALDRTPSQISTTSTDLAAQRRGSDNPFLDSASSSGGLETPRISGGRFSYISNATSRITGVSNISNEYYHRTKASTIPFKLEGTASNPSTFLRPSSASTMTSSSSSSRNITAPNAALKKYSHWSATSSERSPSTEEYLTEPDSESSRRGSGSTTGLSRVDSRESTASTITPPASATSRTSEADSFQKALGRL